jgi:hypothetical protein
MDVQAEVDEEGRSRLNYVCSEPTTIKLRRIGIFDSELALSDAK